jgi:AcrR family transcriptional regulator
VTGQGEQLDTDGSTAVAPVDGRSMRSVRSRRAVIEAFLDLVNEGDFQPTAQALSDRSGISASTIFRLFADMETVHGEGLSIHADRVAHLLDPVPRTGPVDQRICALVEARAQVYEASAGLLRFQDHNLALSEQAKANRSRANDFFRAQIVEVFHDLVGAEGSMAEAERAAVIDSLDAFMSWNMWNRLRTDQARSVPQATALVRGWVEHLLMA